jgi:flagellar hook capping protein FlgD
VRSASGSDWDMETFEPVTFGSSRYPTCFSGPLAGSFAGGGVDFVVGDFNIGHTTPVVPGAGYGVRAFRYAGSGAGTVEWDDGPDRISKDCGTGGNCGAKSGNSWSGVLDVWDVYLFGGRSYSFDFTHTGSADIKLLLFGSTGTTGTFFAPRSARLFETASQTQVFAAPDTGWYGVVLVNDNGLTGTYTVRVVTLPSVGVGDAPRPPTELRAVAPNPSAGRVQIQFALDEPGEAAFEVLDLAGRMVARIPAPRHEVGTWSVDWEGRTSGGTMAAPGIYFVQMRAGGRRVGLARMALVR